MPNPTVTNWFGDIVSSPKVIVEARSVQDIINVLKDARKYPSPVRAVGSNHSTSQCGVAENGTLIRMKMNKILEITKETVTVEAGAINIDIAEALEKKKLQFFINTEIGNLTAGSAACAGTKDASFPGEFGHVGSYVTRMKMVLPSGDLLEITDQQPELMQLARSSYGMFGIVYEVTFRIRPLTPMAVRHETFKLDKFLAKLPELKNLQESLMFYIFPFEDLITVEFRKDNPKAKGIPNRHSWPLRNYLWGTSGPQLARDLGKNIADPKVRYAMIDGFCALWRFKLETLVRSDYTIPRDQIIRYPDVANDSRYTFSLFAFPEDGYGPILSDYFKFCKTYYKDKGYRSDLLNVGYRIAKDQSSLLSYSYDSNVMTIDPVSTGNDGWFPFLAAYNKFCSERGGMPLLNQTFGLTPAMAKKAWGKKISVLAKARQTYDPGNRLLNDYFKTVLGL